MSFSATLTLTPGCSMATRFGTACTPAALTGGSGAADVPRK
jgi:hypothetical protein